MVIMMAGVLLLVDNPNSKNFRNPNDVAAMERIRRNAIATLVPVRDMIDVADTGAAAIRIGEQQGETLGNEYLVTVDFSNSEIALELITSARHNVLETSEWRDGIPYNAQPSKPETTNMFQIKDRLWELSLDYIDTLGLIYGLESEVPANQVVSLEDQIRLYSHLLNQELDKLGLDTVN